MSNPTRLRVSAGVPAGGEFKAEVHSEALGSLAPEAVPSDTNGESRTALIERFCNRGYGEGAAAYMVDDALKGFRGSPVEALKFYDDFGQSEFGYVAAHGMDTADYRAWVEPSLSVPGNAIGGRQVSELIKAGFTAGDAEQWQSRGLYNPIGLAGVGVEAYDALKAICTPTTPPGLGRLLRGSTNSGAFRDLYAAGIDVTDLPGWALTGLEVNGVVEANEAGIDSASVCAYSKESGLGERPAQALAYQTAGVPAATAKAFGPGFTPKDVATLIAGGVPAKVARSLNATPASSAYSIVRLHQGGISTGAEYRKWAPLTDGSIDQIVAAKATGVPLEAATYYSTKFGVNPSGWAALHTAGVTELAPWRSAFVREANQLAAKDFSRDADTRSAWLSGHIAELAEAGVTPGVVRTWQRAGVPLDRIAEGVKSGRSPWEAGAEYRAVWQAETDRQIKDWGPRSVIHQTWPYEADATAPTA